MLRYPFPDKYAKFSQEDYNNVGSSMDCTGLIPSAPLNQAEYDSYRDMYDFLPPEADNEM